MRTRSNRNPNAMSRDSSDFSGEHVDRFLTLFCGREGVYARQWVNRSGKYGYVPIRQELSPAAVRSHLAGEATIALYLIREDNTVSLMAIDIDSKARQSGNIDEAHEMALRIKELGSRHGLSVYLEESGSKGRHCWIFFASPVPAREARQLGKLLVVKAGPVSRGIACEIFPKQDRVSSNALGSLIKLPLGVHQLTGRRCLFLEDDGSPVSDQGKYLHGIRQVSPEAVKAALARLSGKAPVLSERDGPVPADIQQVLDGCRVLKHLVEKAEEVRHLRHSERLVLLYTLGHLGEEGSTFIHRIMSHCDNYSSTITQKWLNRLDPEHHPISCARIKDWLYDIIPVIGCACSDNLLHGMYPSPMFYAPEMPQISDASSSHTYDARLHYAEDIEEKSTAVDMEVPANGTAAVKSERAYEPEDLTYVDEIWREMEAELFSMEGEVEPTMADTGQDGE